MVECGYISSGSEGIANPGELRWSNGMGCNEWLKKEYEDKSNEFYLVLCSTTTIDITVRDQCGTDDEQMELDEPDCGAVALFGQAGPKVLIVLAVFSILWSYKEKH